MSKSNKQFIIQLISFWVIFFMIFAPTANILFFLPKNAAAAEKPSKPEAYATGFGICTVAKITGMGASLSASLITVPSTDAGTWGNLYTQLNTCATEIGNNKIIVQIEDAIEAAATIALEQLLVALTNQIIGYINSDEFGHKGFVLDFNAALNSAAQVAGAKFLNSLTGVNLCSTIPRLKLQIALLPTPDFKTRSECTLDKIVGNIEDFQKDFSKGGWLAWDESMKANNNAFGTWLVAQDEKAMLQFAEVQKKEKEMTDGFSPKKKCLDPSGVDPESVNCKTSITTAPSGAVEVASNFAALSPIESLQNKITALYIKTGPFGPYLSAITNALLNRLTKDGLSALLSTFTENDLKQSNPYQSVIDQVAATSGSFMTAQSNQAQANLILNTLQTLDQFITDTAKPLYFNILSAVANIKTQQDNIINNFWAQGMTGNATVTILSGPTTIAGSGSILQIVSTIYSITQAQIGQATIEKTETTYTDGTTARTFNLINKQNKIEDIDGILTEYNTTYNSLSYSQSQISVAQSPTKLAYDKITAYINTWNGTSGDAAAKSAMDKAIADAIPPIQKVIPSTSTTLEQLGDETLALYNKTFSDTTAEISNQTLQTYQDYLTVVSNIYNSLIGTPITL